MSKSSYALFFKQIEGNYHFLVCKSYMGLELDGREARIFCKSGKESHSPLKTPSVIREEIRQMITRLEEFVPDAINLRTHSLSSNSIHFICDNHKNFYNLLGGQIESGEMAPTSLLRELDEELFINVPDDIKLPMLDNIIGNILESYVSGDKTIFLINYDKLQEGIKAHIEAGIKDPTIFHKLGNCCNVDGVELGEIHSLKWLMWDELKHKIRLVPKKGELSKFNTGDILVRKMGELFGLTGGNYYEKYLKYKVKYLELKANVINNPHHIFLNL